MIIPRRSFITGLVSLIAAPAIVRAGSLMPVKAIDIVDIREWRPDISFNYNNLFSIKVWSQTIAIDAIKFTDITAP